MKLGSDVIASTALRLLNDVGLEGLTMRLLAKELNVQASALYWHFKNKQELLDAMGSVMLVQAAENMESPRRGVSWEDWILERAMVLRRIMLRYRDGARVLAGTHVRHPAVFRTVELTLRTMQDAEIPLSHAACSYPVVFHYTLGFTIEEQARVDPAYGEENPYEAGRFAEVVDSERFPLMSSSLADLFDPDTDAGFERGLRIILAGIRAGVSSADSAAHGA